MVNIYLYYGNGAYKTYAYDDQDRLISESINNTLSRSYIYDKRGNLVETTDLLGNLTTRFHYDLIGRINGITASDGQSMNFVYDGYNRLSLLKWTLGNTALSSSYIYGDTLVANQKPELIYGVKLNGTQQIGYEYDELARLQQRILDTTTPFVTEYTYHNGASTNTTTTLVKTVKNGNNTLEYAYDEVGNITSVKKNGTIIEAYSYDALNQLVSATYGGNTYTYTYDNGGNITEVRKNGVVLNTYTYGDTEWKDLLTAFNGQTITYDDIGNPLNYRNGMNFTWQNGRQLASISQNGNALASYSYNADGLRTSKTINGVETEYYWLNGTLYAQKTGDEFLYFLYDESGIAYGFIVKNSSGQSYYYYEFNLQGDIIGIINEAGTRVVEYTYGAWGDILSITGTLADTIGQKNPLRYRGYYYDAETGFYYVSSRYYDPEIGRFLNADNVVAGVGQAVQGYNLFAYCFNNPVNLDDQRGNWPKWVQKIGNTIKSTVSNVINKVKSVASKVKQDVENFDINNTSEKKVLDSNYVSAYKGKLAIRTNGNRSGSYGALFITKETNNRANPEDIVRHEYGHTKQLEQLGIVNYTLCIGVPSLFEWGSDSEYYRRPWEITADIYGGVQSRSYPGYEAAGFEYLENSRKWGAFVWLTID